MLYIGIYGLRNDASKLLHIQLIHIRNNKVKKTCDMSDLGLASTCCLRTADSKSVGSVITRIVAVEVSASMNSRLMSMSRRES